MNEVIIAMTESDAHVVANKLLQLYLEDHGYNIINLGACTPMKHVVQSAAVINPQAIVLGSQNGHALEDISSLLSLKKDFKINCPVILGGNLSVGAQKSNDFELEFQRAGVDYICQTFDDLLVLLEELADFKTPHEVTYA
ncbi:MAG: methylaspartate mutase sigma subunit [Paraglaciecola sp.]|jgi:methylaspartate mutase sigma subunit